MLSQTIKHLYCISKNAPSLYYILNNSAKNKPILIDFGVQNPEAISRLKF